MTEITVEERQGIKAIQYLQSLAGIDESNKEALTGWRDMSKSQKEFTLKVCVEFGGDADEEIS